MVDMTKMEERNFTCDDVVKQIDALIDLVREKDVKLTIEDMYNIINSVNVIKSRMMHSDGIDESVIDNFWYWCNEFKGLNNLLYEFESNLLNLKNVLE